MPFIQKLYLQLLVGLNIKINEDIYIYIDIYTYALCGLFLIVSQSSFYYFPCKLQAIWLQFISPLKFDSVWHSWMSVFANSYPFFLIPPSRFLIFSYLHLSSNLDPSPSSLCCALHSTRMRVLPFYPHLGRSFYCGLNFVWNCHKKIRLHFWSLTYRGALILKNTRQAVFVRSHTCKNTHHHLDFIFLTRPNYFLLIILWVWSLLIQ